MLSSFSDILRRIRFIILYQYVEWHFFFIVFVWWKRKQTWLDRLVWNWAIFPWNFAKKNYWDVERKLGIRLRQNKQIRAAERSKQSEQTRAGNRKSIARARVTHLNRTSRAVAWKYKGLQPSYLHTQIGQAVNAPSSYDYSRCLWPTGNLPCKAGCMLMDGGAQIECV